MNFAPHPYQGSGIEYIKSHEHCALWWQPGLGKTVTTTTAIADLLDGFMVSKVLIIAPLRVAKSTWPHELEKFSHTRHLNFAVACGTAKQRNAALQSDADIVITNRENVLWLVREYAHRWVWDMVVIDEASAFKSPQAKRFKALRTLRNRKDSPINRMVQLTGSPCSNSLLDVWAPVFLLDRGERLGRTLTAFRDTYFNREFRPWGNVYEPKPDSQERIFNDVGDICMALKADDYLQMPDFITNDIQVNLSTAQAKQYKQLEADYVLELDTGDIEAVTAAVLVNKLAQYTAGAIYRDDTVEFFHDAKLDALEDLIEACNGEPLLVAINFKHSRERILERFKHLKPRLIDSDSIDDWNAGKIQLAIAHPASAGHGLNLQKGGNQLCWYDLTWSLEYYEQFNARLYRQGQDQSSVICHRLIVPDSVDVQIAEALERKESVQLALFNTLKIQIQEKAA